MVHQQPEIMQINICSYYAVFVSLDPLWKFIIDFLRGEKNSIMKKEKFNAGLFGLWNLSNVENSSI